MFLHITHHEVLDCIAAAAFQMFHLGGACGADCGAAASFIIIISLFTLVFFGLFVLCDVGYFVAQSHSVDVSRWSALISSSSFSCRSSEVIV